MFLHRFLMVLCAAGLLFPTPDALAQTDTLAAAAITGNGLRGVITPGQEAPAALLKGAADLGEVVRMFSGLQLKDYGKTDWPWTMFDPEAKLTRHETVFPEEMRKAFQMGKALAE